MTKYYLIAYAENIHGSLIWAHYNDAIKQDPIEWLLESIALKDRSIALTMVREITKDDYKKLSKVLG